VSRLDILGVINFSICNTYTRSIASECYRIRFLSIARKYARADPVSFVCILEATRSVISGSTALHFCVNADSWSPKRLNIHVPFDDYHELVRFLVDVGYGKQVFRRLDRTRGIFGVQLMDMDDLTIEVIQSSSNSALDSVSNGWASSARNGLTPRGVFMSDPVLTSNHHALIAHPRSEYHGNLATKTRTTMSRYGLRGFTFGNTFADLRLSTTQRLYLKRNPEYACTHYARFVGDRFTAVGVFRSRHAEGGTYPLSTGEWVTGGGRL
jgi:hypothetical protein